MQLYSTKKIDLIRTQPPRLVVCFGNRVQHKIQTGYKRVHEKYTLQENGCFATNFLRRNNFVAKIATNSSQNGGGCMFDFFCDEFVARIGDEIRFVGKKIILR